MTEKTNRKPKIYKQHCCDRKSLRNPQNNKLDQENSCWYSCRCYLIACCRQCRDNALAETYKNRKGLVAANFSTICTAHHVVDSSNYFSAAVARQKTSSDWYNYLRTLLFFLKQFSTNSMSSIFDRLYLIIFCYFRLLALLQNKILVLSFSGLLDNYSY